MLVETALLLKVRELCVCNVCIILCISQGECCPLGCNEIWCDVVWCDVYTQCCPMEFAYRVERDVTCGASVYTVGVRACPLLRTLGSLLSLSLSSHMCLKGWEGRSIASFL